jgi:hypothetical protein
VPRRFRTWPTCFAPTSASRNAGAARTAPLARSATVEVASKHLPPRSIAFFFLFSSSHYNLSLSLCLYIQGKDGGGRDELHAIIDTHTLLFDARRNRIFSGRHHGIAAAIQVTPAHHHYPAISLRHVDQAGNGRRAAAGAGTRRRL